MLGLEEEPKAKIHLDSLSAALKKVPIWNKPDNEGYWF